MGTIAVPAVGDPGAASWAGQVAGFANQLLQAYAGSVSVLATTTTTFVKDTGCSDLTFVVTDATSVYRLRYSAGAFTDANGTTVSFRILDGGSSSPTAASPAVAGGTIYLAAALGAGSSLLIAETVQTFTVGTHTVAAFYGRIAGTGNVAANQPTTGQTRLLTVEKLTP